MITGTLVFNKHTLIFKCCHTTSKNTIKLLAENNTVACCINFVKVWSKVVSVWARCSLVHNLITHIFLALACMFDNRLFKASFLGFSYVFRFSFLADCFGGTCTSLPWSIIMTHKNNGQWKQWKSAYVWEARGACQNSRFRINLPVHTNSQLY